MRKKIGKILLVLLASVITASGCGGEPAPTESEAASALRERFPDQAAQVLAQGEAFVATGEGFALDASSSRGAWQGVEVTLPRDGREAIRFRGFGGVDVHVREIGVQGVGVLTDRAVTYRRVGGTSFWTTAPGARIDLQVDAGGEALLVDPLWVPTGLMITSRSHHTATLLGSGKVLVTGGEAWGTMASAELYMPAPRFT